MNRPLVSVIIAVKDSENTIRACLDSVMAGDYEPLEVIVIDDGSSDRTPRILEDYKGKIVVMRNDSSLGPAVSRNNAAQKAAGEYIAFTDGDCVVDRRWVSEMVRGCESDAKAAGCGGSQDIPDDASAFERLVFRFMQKTALVTEYVKRAKDAHIREVDHNPSCTVLYRRSIFLDAGGFSAGLWPGEDVELDFCLRRAGFRLLFNPAALVYHHRPKTLSTFLRMMMRYGVAQGCLLRKYGFFRKVQFVPFLASGVAVALAYLSFYSSGLFVTALACLVLVVLLYARNLFVFLLGIFALAWWHAGFLKGFIKKST